MAEDLGARLVKAGLLSRGELARATAQRAAGSAAFIAALHAEGLPEDALVGFFVSECRAALAAETDLASPDLALVRVLPRATADALCALPLRRSGADVLVALADPTDEAARAEVGRALGANVLPATAALSLLREALHAAFAHLAAAEPSIDVDVDVDVDGLFDDDPPLELVRRRPTTTPATPYARTGDDAKRSDDNRLAHFGDDDAHMLLVRTKPVSAPAPSRTSAPAPAPAPPPAPAPAAVPAPRAAPPTSPKDDLLSADRWSTLPAESTRTPTDPGGLLAPTTKLPAAARLNLGAIGAAVPAVSLPDLGPALAAVRAAATRDEAVRLACDAALPACRCAVFLALKRNVLQGRDVVGGGVSPEAIYNVWIPVTSASIFRDAITQGTPHFGPYGSTAADGIYKAAIGTVGGDALIQPVHVAGKPVAVLCADDLRFGARGRQRLESLALALGDAFERLIVSHKK
jgi:hypothetical protein